MTILEYNGLTIKGHYNLWRIYKGSKEMFSTTYRPFFNSEDDCKRIIDASNKLKAMPDKQAQLTKLKSIIDHEYEAGNEDREREERRFDNWQKLDLIKSL